MSIRFQADADLHFAIVKAVRRQEPAIDFASSDESDLRGLSDPEVLERTDTANRVLVSQDRRTMVNHFKNRITAGYHSPGLLIVSQAAPIGQVVESIIFLWSISEPIDLRDQVYHVPSLMRHVYSR